MDRRFRNEASTRVHVTRKYSILIRIRLTTSRYEDKGRLPTFDIVCADLAE